MPRFSLPDRKHGGRGSFSIEEYSTVYLPVYKPPASLIKRCSLYGLGSSLTLAAVATTVFLLHWVYRMDSIFAYLDLFSILAILASTGFGLIARSLAQEQKTRLFRFHQPPSTSSILGKALEYVVYVLSFACTAYLIVSSPFVFHNLVSSLSLSFALGGLYMICLKPGMAKWIIWMIVSPWYHATLMKPHQIRSLTSSHPHVSVIVPAWNEEVGILSTMQSILTSTYSPLELIVINDGSTDSSDAKIRAFLAEHQYDFPGKSIVYHYQQNAGKSSALNVGISLAKGEIIITTDADCIMAPDCIAYLTQAFADPEVMGCTGDYRVGNVHSLLGRIQAIEYAIGFYTRKADSLFGTVFVMSGTVSAFRRSVFERIGKFHTGNITEDLEITMRMHKAGMKIVSEARALVYTESPVTLKGLFRQRLRWVRGTLDAFGEHHDILFSQKREHGKMHSRVVLPLIRMNHFAVLLQVLCKYAILIFCLMTHQYATLAFTICLITVIVSISILSDIDYRETALLSPIAWILLEVPNCIYVLAFLVGWWNYLNKKQQSWQRWKRQGIKAS